MFTSHKQSQLLLTSGKTQQTLSVTGQTFVSSCRFTCPKWSRVISESKMSELRHNDDLTIGLTRVIYLSIYLFGLWKAYSSSYCDTSVIMEPKAQATLKAWQKAQRFPDITASHGYITFNIIYQWPHLSHKVQVQLLPLIVYYPGNRNESYRQQETRGRVFKRNQDSPVGPWL